MLPNGELPPETAAPRDEERRPRRAPRGERPDGRRPGGGRGRGAPRKDAAPAAAAAQRLYERSEEHTSELQSLMRISYAVFCLKKKTKTKLSTKIIHDETIEQPKD